MTQSSCFLLILSPDLQSRPVVVTIFTSDVCTSIPALKNLAKQNKFYFKTVIATGGTVDLAVGMTHVLLLFYCTFNANNLDFELHYQAKKNMPNEVMNTDLTENLFEVAHAVALDLGALNIQRGRDHGLPSYATWRKYCGFGETHSWEDLAMDISDSGVRLKLAAVYGNPKNVDVWVGGLLEDSVPGGKVGRTVRCLLVEQFKRTRDGDRLVNFYHIINETQSHDIKMMKLFFNKVLV